MTDPNQPAAAQGKTPVAQAGQAPEKEKAEKPAKISATLQAQLMTSARRAGATENDLADLADELAEAPASAQAKIEQSIAKLRKKNVSAYYVRGPGKVMHEGEMHESGSSLLLTPAEAAELGEALGAGKAPPRAPKPSAREDGHYRVKGPGSVFVHGRFYGPGDDVKLSADEARSLAGVELELTG